MQRVCVAMRVEEGQAGTILAYIVPKNPPKTCKRINCNLQALSLHYRIRDASAGLPLAQLDISGDFLTADVHQWLACCLPDLPKQMHGQDIQLAYESAVHQTQVTVQARDGSLRLASDNVCSLAILRDVLMRCARLDLNQSSLTMSISEPNTACRSIIRLQAFVFSVLFSCFM
jgi:hypothetical protein